MTIAVIFDSPFYFGWKQIAAAIGIPAVAGLATYILWNRDAEKSGLTVHSDFQKNTIIVPGDKVGAVIGRNGSVVREIEQTSGAKVRVQANPPKDAGEEEDGTVIIQGMRENVLAAEIAVRKVIAQTVPVLTEDVFVPSTSIGFIIGKKGASIRELSFFSGAKVIIGKTGKEMETITIKGRPQAIDAAKIWLEKKVKESEEMRAKWKDRDEKRQKRKSRESHSDDDAGYSGATAVTIIDNEIEEPDDDDAQQSPTETTNGGNSSLKEEWW